MGILTSNSSQNVKEFLKNHQLDVFDFTHSVSKFWGKSSGLKRLIRKYKLKPDHLLYIGDEIRDLEAAKKAGIRFAAVTWGYNSSKALKACHPRLPH